MYGLVTGERQQPSSLNATCFGARFCIMHRMEVPFRKIRLVSRGCVVESLNTSRRLCMLKVVTHL